MPPQNAQGVRVEQEDGYSAVDAEHQGEWQNSMQASQNRLEWKRPHLYLRKEFSRSNVLERQSQSQ